MGPQATRQTMKRSRRSEIPFDRFFRGVAAEEAAFIGDDAPDAAVFELVGLAVAVGDAHDEAKNAAHYVTKNAGGRGAVREVVDMLLAKHAE